MEDYSVIFVFYCLYLSIAYTWALDVFSVQYPPQAQKYRKTRRMYSIEKRAYTYYIFLSNTY